MKKVGISDLPLHPGKAPKWLFERMVKLSKGITETIIHEYGHHEFLRRVSDPFWFQAFGCVLGFDWHSSGLTTTVCGALKESLKTENLGLVVCGGKGKASRKTIQDIEKNAEVFGLSTKKTNNLKYSSRISAKVDNTAIQDGYNLYHHVFIFTEKASWTVVQQGLNSVNKYARRYHWLSDNIQNFVIEPHSAICCDRKQENALDMTAKKSEETRRMSTDIVNDNPSQLQTFLNNQKTLQHFMGDMKTLSMPRCHYIKELSKQTLNTLQKAYEIQPKNYEELLMFKGMGPRSVRALALISELIYGKEPSWQDPVKFSFSHGGKDGIPHPVDRDVMDKSIEILKTGIEEAKIGNTEKIKALKRLQEFI